MPQIKARNIKPETLCSISEALIDDLQNLLNCPRDFFTIELIHSTSIENGSIVNGYPFIEIAWFDRGQEIQDKVAKIVTSHIQKSGYNNIDIVFNLLNKSGYYENGSHF